MKRLLLVLALPASLCAQGYRITGVSTLQFIELRQLVLDTVLASSVPGFAAWRNTVDGVPASCVVGAVFCTVEGSGSRINAAPVLQDLTLAAWGWSEGLSVHANVRVRSQIGATDPLLFPRANDHLDAIDAYAELDRATWRARLGRQWSTGALGAYAFDGVNGLWRHDHLSAEGWSGRALLGGLNDPYTSAQLAAVDNLPPQQDGYLFGGTVRYRPDPLSAAAFTYQRILTADRTGLYAERAAFNASTRRYAATVDAGFNFDVAAAEFDEARVRVGTNWDRPVVFSVEARHSRPYFELWTIWGAFSPVGFDESRVSADWAPRGAPWALTARGAYRTYAETNTGISLRTNGWRAGGDASWQNSGRLSALASYDVDIGSGASSTDAHVGGRWLASPDLSLGGTASVTQSIYEFRVGTGRIYGAAADGSYRLSADIRIAADVGLYQHTLTNGAPGPDWTQRRAAMRIEWTMGRDPGTP
ncbi:MAG: hypothetical protein ABJE47_20345 [bacterium]